MKQELEQQLIAKYPKLFGDVNKSPMESLMCFGCECGDGWYDILDNLLRIYYISFKLVSVTT